MKLSLHFTAVLLIHRCRTGTIGVVRSIEQSVRTITKKKKNFHLVPVGISWFQEKRMTILKLSDKRMILCHYQETIQDRDDT